MPHPIGDHALLADGRTAALLDPEGEVAWLCWPRVDSDACLLALLDPRQGGTFALRPRGEGVVEAREYSVGLALRTVWRQHRGRLQVDEALSTDGRPGLLRMLRAEGAPVLVEVRFRPAFAFATSPATVTETGRRAVAAGGGIVLAVDAPAPWRIEDGVAVCIFKVVPGYPTAVALGEAADAVGLGDAPERMAATLRHWRATEAAVTIAANPAALCGRALGLEAATRMRLRAAAVLTGLRQRGGGIVAAPTTSIPQGGGGGRTWDYRYAWLRDTALAAQALLHLGLVDDAHGLGAFCGDVCLEFAAPPPLVRVDESPPPPERELVHLSGYGGAAPVRVGNLAAGMLQLDTAGEVLELAWELYCARALPESLRRAIPSLARLAAERAEQPDHGIWEVRGDPLRYTHSAVLAWSGLRRAAALTAAGVCAGAAAAWATAAARIRARLLAQCAGGQGLQLLDRGGGPDAALSQAVLLGLFDPGDPCARATVGAIATTLGRSAGTDRYQGRPDGNDAPCAPFVFPAFWLAAAEEMCGLDGVPRF
ncbi:MAG TPA: glycoside hydrolase family 15 protein, partial [Candidatus Dormibacteraeota bacterium]